MPSLYDLLKIPNNATQDDIDKAYKAMAYIYTKSNDKESLLSCNSAYSILKDPYKRSFYNIFGDNQIELLLRPAEGFVYSRFLTKRNMLLIYLFAIVNIGWIMVMPYFMKIISKCILLFSPIIISPIFLIVVSLNIRITLKQYKVELNPFYRLIIQTLATSLIICTVSLYLDGIFTRIVSTVNIILLNMSFLLFIHFKIPRTVSYKFDMILMTLQFSTGLLMIFFRKYPRTVLGLFFIALYLSYRTLPLLIISTFCIFNIMVYKLFIFNLLFVLYLVIILLGNYLLFKGIKQCKPICNCFTGKLLLK